MLKEIAKSFEEGGEVIGDILTKGKIKKDIKIGVLTCGYFEYWRMYPDLKEKVEGDLLIIENRLKAMYKNIIFSGMVDTLDSADAAGELFKKEDIDVVLLVCGTYVPDFISLTAIDFVSKKPLIIFSTQVHENVDIKGNYEGSLRNSGIIGISQLTGTLRKMKRDYKIIVGSVNDDRGYAKIDKYIKANQVVSDLHECNIGVIGHVFRGMYDIELSKTFFKNTFGANIILIQNCHLLDIWQNVSQEEVNIEKAKLLARFKVKHVTAQDVFNAVRLAIAMRKISEKFKLNAMCLLDQHFVQKQVHASIRIGASLLMEQTDMCVNCEGDLGGLIMMMMMKSISGKSPLMGEWGEYDEKSNSCLIIGHGIGTPDLAKSDEHVMLTRTPEEWGFDGAGLNYELIVKPGIATLGHLMEVQNGYRMLLSKVESIDFPKLDFDELHALVKTQKPIKEYLEDVFDFGVSHHCILGLTDMSEELSIVAELLEIQKFYIQ